MRLSPKHLIWVVVAVAMIIGAVYLKTAEVPGQKQQAGNVITKPIGTAEAKATATFDITLQEGGDAEHEADHVFAALKSDAISSAAFDTQALELVVSFDDALIKESDIRQLMVASGYVAASAADAVAATLSADGTSQELQVGTGERLNPSLMSAKAGVPLKIVFAEGASHLVTIAIPELGIQENLSNGGATLEIADPKAGTYNLVCAEGFTDGTLLVE